MTKSYMGSLNDWLTEYHQILRKYGCCSARRKNQSMPFCVGWNPYLSCLFGTLYLCIIGLELGRLIIRVLDNMMDLKQGEKEGSSWAFLECTYTRLLPWGFTGYKRRIWSLSGSQISSTGISFYCIHYWHILFTFNTYPEFKDNNKILILLFYW